MPLTSCYGIFSNLSLDFVMFSFSFWSHQRFADTEQLLSVGILKETFWSLFCTACQSYNCSVAQNALKEKLFLKNLRGLTQSPLTPVICHWLWWDLEQELCISIKNSITSFKLKKKKSRKQFSKWQPWVHFWLRHKQVQKMSPAHTSTATEISREG